MKATKTEKALTKALRNCKVSLYEAGYTGFASLIQIELPQRGKHRLTMREGKVVEKAVKQWWFEKHSL